MSKVRPLLHQFNAGEASAAGMCRVDQERTRLVAEVQENLIPFVVGKAQFRPGGKHLGNSASNNRAQFIEFIKAVDDAALLELTNALLRVWIDDELLTREAVTAPITNGDFSSSTGWTTGVTGGATANINSSAAGALYLAAPNRGGLALAKQEVASSNIGDEHGLAIAVQRGPVVLRVGSTEGGDEYINETTLPTGVFSLAFTPTAISAGADSYTKMLLHGDDVDGATTVTDSSPSPHTVAVSGGVQIDTAQSVFGGASILFPGAVGDGLRLDGSSDFAFGTDDFTIDFRLRLAVTTSGQIIYDGRPTSGNGNYQTIYYSGGIRFAVAGTDRIIGPSLSINTWYHVALARAAGVTRMFIDGVQVGASFTDTTNYLIGTSRPAIGNDGNNFGAGPMNAWIDELRVSKGISRWSASFVPPSAAYSGSNNTFWVQFSTTLERAAIVDSVTIEAAGIVSLAAPWATNDLRAIQWDQSLDIIYAANNAWQQRQIMRIGNARSWGVCLYVSDDGPFTTGRTARTRLRAVATRGNTQLIAETAFFSSDHVGAMFRLSHQSFSGSFALAAENTYTDVVRVNGIATLNDYSVTVSGTFSGTLSIEHSFDGPDSGFTPTGTTISAPGTQAMTQGAEYENIEFWVRVGFRAGAYVSGAAVVQINYNGHSKSGVCRITGYNSPTSVNIEVLSDFGATDYTEDWQEGEWSQVRGWPAAVRFFDGRLWLAGTDKLWASESDEYYAFNLDTEGDAGSIQRNIATGGTLADCRSLLSLQRLICLTQGSEVPAKSSSFDEPLTPTNITLKDASTQGAAAATPVKIDGRGVFIQRSGARLYELLYDFEAQDYSSNDLMRLNEDIGNAGLLTLAAQRQPDTYVWAPRGDGECVLLIYEPRDKVAGFVRIIAAASDGGEAEIEDVAVLPSNGAEDRVYWCVKRTINGSEVRFIEKLALFSEARGAAINHLADAFVYNAGPVTAFTGLSHLEGEEVVAWGTRNGASAKIGTTFTVSGGQITLPNAYTDVTVGLPYEWRYKSARLAYGADDGTALLQKKLVRQVGLLCSHLNINAVKYGGKSFDDADMRSLSRTRKGATVSETATLTLYEEPELAVPNNWDTDSRIYLKGESPLPITLNGLVMLVETKEQ